MKKKNTKHTVRRLADFLLSAVYPERCSICGELSRENESICEECIKYIIPLRSPLCHNCAVPLSEHNESRCEEMPAPVIAAFYYGGSVKKLIIDLKERKSRTTFRVFAPYFFGKIEKEYEGVIFDTVVCVPSYRDKLFRGKTSSVVIGECAAEYLGADFDRDILLKIRNTKKQHTLNRDERMTNLSGSISANKKKDSFIKGKVILMCDDVKTTGSTLRECANQLYSAGAKRVYCACICVTDYHV